MPFVVDPVYYMSQVVGTRYDWVMVKIQELDEHRVASIEGLDPKLFELLSHFARSSDWRNSS